MRKYKKRSQAAFEFLMTYGWVFLVILVVIGALSYFGILSPSALLPSKCVSGTEIGCEGGKIQEDSIQIQLRNNIGSTATLRSVEVEHQGTPITCQTGQIDEVWQLEESKLLTIYCNLSQASVRKGDRKKLQFKINYGVKKGKHELSKTITGELFDTVLDGSLEKLYSAQCLQIQGGVGLISVELEPKGTLTSPLRIQADDGIYGVVLVDISDPEASAVRIETGSGVRALKKSLSCG